MKRHVSYFDLLRLLASFFVVLMHAATEGLRNDLAGRAGWYVLVAMSSLTFCAVPLFFMVSGYLLTESAQTCDTRVLLTRRMPRLAAPLAFWSFCYVIQQAWLEGDLTGAAVGKGVVNLLQTSVNVDFWFMYALLAMYLISPVLCGGLKSLNRSGHLLVLGLIGLLKLRSLIKILWPDFCGAYLGFDVLDYTELFSGHLSAFVLGWYLGRTEKRIPQPLLAAAALALWACVTAGTAARSLACGEYVQDFQSQRAFFEVALAACIFLLVKQAKLNENGRLLGAARSWAPYTFAVYLMHVLIMRFYNHWLPMPRSCSAILLLGAALYAVSMVLARLLGQVPGLRYAACGLGRRK